MPKQQKRNRYRYRQRKKILANSLQNHLLYSNTSLFTLSLKDIYLLASKTRIKYSNQSYLSGIANQPFDWIYDRLVNDAAMLHLSYSNNPYWEMGCFIQSDRYSREKGKSRFLLWTNCFKGFTLYPEARNFQSWSQTLLVQTQSIVEVIS